MSIPIVTVIMAGGSGERFWPLSRKELPKQLLRLTDDNKTMLHDAVERVRLLAPPDRTFIAANTLLKTIIQDGIHQIPPDNILAEPYRRNTAGCLAYAAAHMLARFNKEDDDFLMAVTTADHLIGDEETFQRTAAAALHHAEHHDDLVVIGLKPTRPETGYGYIEIDENSSAVSSFQGISIYPVNQFREKPSREIAEDYIKSGCFFWNSGMFFWRISVFLDSLDRCYPEFSNAIRQMRDALLENSNPAPVIDTIFKKVPNISIDYALLEKTDNVFAVKGEFPWNDVGSWDSLSRFRTPDENGNICTGDPILIDCRNVTVYNKEGSEKIAVGAIGLEDVVIVASGDGVLICPKNRAQEVRKIVDLLKERNADQL